LDSQNLIINSITVFFLNQSKLYYFDIFSPQNYGHDMISLTSGLEGGKINNKYLREFFEWRH
jgi:hypothetical protein